MKPLNSNLLIAFVRYVSQGPRALHVSGSDGHESRSHPSEQRLDA